MHSLDRLGAPADGNARASQRDDFAAVVEIHDRDTQRRLDIIDFHRLDLVERLGVARASLYATFGDKHQLYVKALVRYAETRDPDPVQLLSQPGPLEACWKFEDLCAHLGLSWDDERLPTVVAARYPNTRASFTRLVSWLVHEKNRLAAVFTR